MLEDQILLDAPLRRQRLYSVARSTNSACAYYRIIVPWKTAQKLGLADYKIDDYQDMVKEARSQWAIASDIHLYYLILDEILLDRKKAFDSTPPVWSRDHCRWVYPPCMVFDADDDVELIDYTNPKFGALGTYAPNNRKLKPGDSIMMRKDGEVLPIWTDGQIYGEGQQFDIKENLERMKRLGKLARISHGVTVPNEYLAGVYKRRYKVKNTYVFPNSVVFEDHPKIDMRRDNKQIKILWQGGWSHGRDINTVTNALGNIARKYKHVKFIFWGQEYKVLQRFIPSTQYEYHNWVPHDAYFLKLATMVHDIAIAPLEETPFNLSKSAIKFYEAAALPRPVPTVASDIGPYKEIIDGETGLLSRSEEEFEEKLSGLIEDESLRKELATNAKEWVWENRRAEITVPPLLAWYRSLKYS